MRAALLALLAAAPAFAAPTCTDCHGDTARRSYELSKHGVIARLEAGRERARAPGCADCHVFEAKAEAPHHSDPSQREKAREQAVSGCGACHSPRYVAEQLAAGRRALAIGEMKLREAGAVVETARRELRGEALNRIEALYARMREHALRELRLGLAHQSPDHQWWHGQAALDGDLLRIKGALEDARRGLAARPPVK